MNPASLQLLDKRSQLNIVSAIDNKKDEGRSATCSLPNQLPPSKHPKSSSNCALTTIWGNQINLTNEERARFLAAAQTNHPDKESIKQLRY
jgi:hypothetical protein